MTKYSETLKFEIVQEYLSGKTSQRKLAEKYIIHKSDVKKWIDAYRENGVEGLLKTHGTYDGDLRYLF